MTIFSTIIAKLRNVKLNGEGKSSSGQKKERGKNKGIKVLNKNLFKNAKCNTAFVLILSFVIPVTIHMD